MNPAYPPQPYQQPSAPPVAYSAPAGQPPPIGFTPGVYASPQPAYAPTNHYAAPPPPAPYPAPAPPPAYAPAPAPAYVGPQAVPYNANGAYTPNQPTYIQPPASNLTVVQPTRTVYVADPGPSLGTTVGLGLLAGAAFGSHHHHHGYGHHHRHGFGHHGFGHHGFGHHGHHC